MPPMIFLLRRLLCFVIRLRWRCLSRDRCVLHYSENWIILMNDELPRYSLRGKYVRRRLLLKLRRRSAKNSAYVNSAHWKYSWYSFICDNYSIIAKFLRQCIREVAPHKIARRFIPHNMSFPASLSSRVQFLSFLRVWFYEKLRAVLFSYRILTTLRIVTGAMEIRMTDVVQRHVRDLSFPENSEMGIRRFFIRIDNID